MEVLLTRPGASCDEGGTLNGIWRGDANVGAAKSGEASASSAHHCDMEDIGVVDRILPQLLRQERGEQVR